MFKVLDRYMTYTPLRSLHSACLMPLLVVSHAQRNCRNGPCGVNTASNLHILTSESQLVSENW